MKVVITYFFVWGNHPALSLAELLSALTRWGIPFVLKNASIEAGILEVSEYLSPAFMTELGGTVKFGIVESSLKGSVTPDALTSMIRKEGGGKLTFGLSAYRADNFSPITSARELKRLGGQLKKIFQTHQSVRFIAGIDRNLSSVTVAKNKLIEKGIEIAIFSAKRGFLLGRTTAVQPFEDYSTRDYGRLSVDPNSGMLPPKLAQMMLNLSSATAKDIILDPFCGSGTILQEALLMGWHHVVGSDVSKRAVEDTKKNLIWLKNRYGLKTSVVRLFSSDARKLSEHFQKNAVSAVITEPHLGPPLKARFDRHTAERVRDELEALYFLSFVDFKKYLKPHARVVMVWPVFLIKGRGDNTVSIGMTKALEKQGFFLTVPFKEEILEHSLGGLTQRGGFIYGRPKQKVWREIVVFEYRGGKI